MKEGDSKTYAAFHSICSGLKDRQPVKVTCAAKFSQKDHEESRCLITPAVLESPMFIGVSKDVLLCIGA